MSQNKPLSALLPNYKFLISLLKSRILRQEDPAKLATLEDLPQELKGLLASFLGDKETQKIKNVSVKSRAT